MILILLFVLTICKGIDSDISNPSSEELRNAFLLSLGAGLSTVIGAVAAFCLRKEDLKKDRSTFLAGCLSFAAAVMIYVSFVEIWPEALLQFEEVTDNEQVAHIYTSLTFFGGIVVGLLCSKAVHRCEHLHATRTSRKIKVVNKVEMVYNQTKAEPCAEKTPAISDAGERKTELLRTGIVTALTIALHNFPEGLVTFLAALADWKVGVATAFAIAMHNIPEGISISIPYYYASESRWKAFILAFLSGVAEPIGALIGWAILGDVWGHDIFGVMFGLTAGVMVFISFHELLPLARKNDPDDKVTTAMVFIGMLVMDVSLFV